MTEIRVVALSKPQHVAGEVAEQVRRHGRIVLRAAGAVHQAVKAVALAVSFLAVEGIRAVCVPAGRTGDGDSFDGGGR